MAAATSTAQHLARRSRSNTSSTTVDQTLSTPLATCTETQSHYVFHKHANEEHGMETISRLHHLYPNSPCPFNSHVFLLSQKKASGFSLQHHTASQEICSLRKDNESKRLFTLRHL